jgi:hypothetical protein
MICPKHTQDRRNEYCNLIQRELRKNTHNTWVVLPIGRLLSRDDNSELWARFMKAIKYRRRKGELPKMRYFFILEIQDNNLHLHGYFHSEERPNEALLKDIWKKLLKDYDRDKAMGGRMQVEPAETIEAGAEYITKTGGFANMKITLPVRNQFKRMVFASHYYGLTPNDIAIKKKQAARRKMMKLAQDSRNFQKK